MNLLSLLLIPLTSFSLDSSPFRSYPLQEALQAPLTPTGWLVHEAEDQLIYIDSLDSFIGQDYYLVKTPYRTSISEWLQSNTHVVFEKPGHFSIVNIQGQQTLNAVAEEAHSQGGFCGFIEKITPQSIQLNTRLAPPPRPLNTSEDWVQVQLSQFQVENILGKIELMESWQTRHHESPSGLATPQRLLEVYRSLTPDYRHDVSFDIIKHKGSEQASLRVRIAGQTRPEEIIILGSHLDSIHPRNNDNAPGADDNASGTATNIEIFRALMEQGFKPERTIEIHAYGAEEIGLVGSQEMAESYSAQNKKVLAMLQMDMNGYTRSEAAIHFITNGTNSNLTQDLIQLGRKYLNIPIRTGLLFFGTSDHASWRRQGYAVAFPTENPSAFNRNIHTEHDTLNHINSPEQILGFAQLGWLYILYYAGLSPP